MWHINYILTSHKDASKAIITSFCDTNNMFSNRCEILTIFWHLTSRNAATHWIFTLFCDIKNMSSNRCEILTKIQSTTCCQIDVRYWKYNDICHLTCSHPRHYHIVLRHQQNVVKFMWNIDNIITSNISGCCNPRHNHILLWHQQQVVK